MLVNVLRSQKGDAMSKIGRRLVKIGGGHLELETFEVPEPGPGEVLVRVHRSQVSAGSEKSDLLDKESPQSAVIRKARTFATRARASDESQNEVQRFSGYTTVGRVQAAGAGMEEYKPGDRVLAPGVHGSHWLTYPLVDLPGSPSNARSPIQRIEYDITDEQAAFSVLGDVALHGVRRAELQIDESVAVFGQGMVGQLTTALCRMSGAYPVIAVDLDADRLALAKQSGATHTVDASNEDAAEAVRSITDGGAQSVIHATRAAQTLVDCMKAAADRGKVVVVGFPFDTVETGLRDELLDKELQVRSSNEAWGLGSPHPYWPWTRQRNRRAIMRMIATGDLKVDHLISHVAKPEEAEELYQKIIAGPKGWMGIFFDWDDEPS